MHIGSSNNIRLCFAFLGRSYCAWTNAMAITTTVWVELSQKVLMVDLSWIIIGIGVLIFVLISVTALCGAVLTATDFVLTAVHYSYPDNGFQVSGTRNL